MTRAETGGQKLFFGLTQEIFSIDLFVHFIFAMNIFLLGEIVPRYTTYYFDVLWINGLEVSSDLKDGLSEVWDEFRLSDVLSFQIFTLIQPWITEGGIGNQSIHVLGIIAQTGCTSYNLTDLYMYVNLTNPNFPLFLSQFVCVSQWGIIPYILYEQT